MVMMCDKEAWAQNSAKDGDIEATTGYAALVISPISHITHMRLHGCHTSWPHILHDLPQQTVVLHLGHARTT